MVNLKRADLKGYLAIGGGWLISNGWAVQTAGDNKLASLETIKAAFSGLNVVEASATVVAYLNERIGLSAGILEPQACIRSRVLVEGEDGRLTRVYRSRDGVETICLAVDALRILGEPPILCYSGGATYVCKVGFIARTTDECPPWAGLIQ